MKNRMEDVRNHLVMAMETLNGEAVTDHDVERARALSGLANSYISSVKTEIDAIRVASETGFVPQSIGKPQSIDARALGCA